MNLNICVTEQMKTPSPPFPHSIQIWFHCAPLSTQAACPNLWSNAARRCAYCWDR